MSKLLKFFLCNVKNKLWPFPCVSQILAKIQGVSKFFFAGIPAGIVQIYFCFMRICESLCNSVRVCANLRKFVRICGNLRKFARVCANLHEFVRNCASLCESARVWFGLAGLVWFGLVGLVWFSLVQFGMVWLVWVWYGMVWLGLIWFDVLAKTPGLYLVPELRYP